jgi:hypothetical protein
MDETGLDETGQLRIGLNGIARFQIVGAGNTAILAVMNENPKAPPFVLERRVSGESVHLKPS